MKQGDSSRNEEETLLAGSGETSIAVRALTLSIRGGDAPAHSVRIEVPRFVVGSGESADLRLADKTVSREHVTFTLQDNGVRIRDEGSRNGTWIDKARITEALLTGDTTLRVGNTVIEARLDGGLTDLEVSKHQQFGGAIGRSTTMRHLFATLERASASDVTILLEGESGVGKEVLASAIHASSSRAQHPFIVVDCGAISPALLESELFGHTRGAFTGAATARVGLVQQADGGTLFLDEIGELPLDMQPKLLRLLEQREVRPVGSNAAERVDIRIVSATNRSLAEAVGAKTFRQDLFYRLAVARVHIAPLRDRKDDIEPIANLFFKKASGQDEPLPPEIMAMFRAYHWPGNVRELRNVVERYAHLGATAPAELFGLSPGKAPARTEAEDDELLALPYSDARRGVLERFEQRYFKSLMVRSQNVIAAAADLAGIARPSLYRILERIGHPRAKKDSDK